MLQFTNELYLFYHLNLLCNDKNAKKCKNLSFNVKKVSMRQLLNFNCLSQTVSI